MSETQVESVSSGDAASQDTATLALGSATVTVPNRSASMDKFGRYLDERIILLETDDAERIAQECEAGKHDGFDQCLHYVIERGLAEIKRQRESLAKLKEQRSDAQAMKALRQAVKNLGADATDPAKLASAMKALGIVIR